MEDVFTLLKSVWVDVASNRQIRNREKNIKNKDTQTGSGAWRAIKCNSCLSLSSILMIVNKLLVK